MKQTKAVSHIRALLLERGVEVPSRISAMANGQRWVVFELHGRQIGIDPASGIWQRESDDCQWRCVATHHTTSGACLAVDFLSKG